MSAKKKKKEGSTRFDKGEKGEGTRSLSCQIIPPGWKKKRGGGVWADIRPKGKKKRDGEKKMQQKVIEKRGGCCLLRQKKGKTTILGHKKKKEKSNLSRKIKKRGKKEGRGAA